MTHYQGAVPAHQGLSPFEEIDLAEMENVSGGCEQCSNGGKKKGSSMSSLMPLLMMTQANRKR